MVWVGWQGDIPSKPGQMALTAPALKGVTGPAREEFVFDTTASPARATLTLPAADPANLTVTVRAAWADARQTPSGLSARLVDPSTVEVMRPDGFDAGALYEITTRRAIRCRSAWALPRCAMSQASCAAIRRPANPLQRPASVRQPRDRLRRLAIRPLPARLPPSRLQRGSQGRVVFDGLMPHVAGTRRMATNVRFGCPAATRAIRRTRPGRPTCSRSPMPR
jgi:hypothetical protein